MFTLREKTFLVTAITYVTFVLLPIFADFTGINIQMVSVLVVGVLLCLYPSAFLCRRTYWCMGYIMVMLLYYALGNRLTIGIGTMEDGRKLIIESAFILPSLSILNVLYYLNKGELYSIIFRSAMIVFGLSLLYLVPMTLMNGEILRLSDHSYIEVTIPGLPSYPLMHSYAMMLVLFIYACSVTRGRYKVISSAAFVLMLYLIFRTYITTSFVIVLALLLFMIIYQKGRLLRTGIVASVFIIAGLFVLKSGLLYSFLEEIKPVFENTAVEAKILDVQTTISSGEYTGESITVRADRHDISMNSFLESVFIGDVDSALNTDVSGEHSTILDRLAGFGLFGFIPFIMIFITSFIDVFKLLVTERARVYYAMAFVVTLVYLYMKGLFGNEGWFTFLVFIPTGMVYLQYYHEMNVESED